MRDQINLLDVLVKIVKHRWMIFKIVITITFLSLVISLIWPKSYKATVRFFPPPRESAGITNILSSFIQSSMPSNQLSSETILVILRSRTLMEKVIKKFKLAEVYGTEIMEHLLKKLEGHIEINEIREGGFAFNPLIAIEFSFIDENPVRAEQITEYYILQLDSIMKSIIYNRALFTYSTIERRFLRNKEELRKAEEEFKKFQQNFGIYEVNIQTQKVIENLAELKTQLIKTEIEEELLKKTVDKNNPLLKKIQYQKNIIKKKYNEFVKISEKANSDKLFQPLEKLPDLIAQYGRLYREVTVQNRVYEFLYPQYEQAKLMTSTGAQGIQILDPAKMPTYKYRPKRLYIVLSGFVFSIFLSLFIVFLKEMIEKNREENSDNYQKIIYIKNSILKDLHIPNKNIR